MNFEDNYNINIIVHEILNLTNEIRWIDWFSTTQHTSTIHYPTHEPSVNCTAGLLKAQKYSGSENHSRHLQLHRNLSVL